jgi:hypothetical protein
MIHNEALRADVIENMIEQLFEINPNLDRARAAHIAVEIFEKDERRQTACRDIKVTTKLIRARLDCLIFFKLVEEGWGRTTRLPSGAIVAENSPLTWDWRLNFPKRSRLAAASKRFAKSAQKKLLDTSRLGETGAKVANATWRQRQRNPGSGIEQARAIETALPIGARWI